MKIDFSYQENWLRWVWALPSVGVMLIIQTFFTENLPIRSWSVILIYIAIPLIVLSIYYSITDKFGFYKKKGVCYVDENKIDFFLNEKKRTVNILDISDIFLCKKNTFGLEYIIFRIKYKNKVIKIVGASMKKDFNIEQTEFGIIFCLVSKYATHLSHSKDIFGDDIAYWLQKEGKL